MSEPIIPKALGLTDEQKQLKTFVVGTISIDANGIWNVHYIGPHIVDKKAYFGNGQDSSLNLRQLLNVVGSRLTRAKDVFVSKIQELEANVSEQPNTDDESGSGLRNSPDDGGSVS